MSPVRVQGQRDQKEESDAGGIRGRVESHSSKEEGNCRVLLIRLVCWPLRVLAIPVKISFLSLHAIFNPSYFSFDIRLRNIVLYFISMCNYSRINSLL